MRETNYRVLKLPRGAPLEKSTTENWEGRGCDVLLKTEKQNRIVSAGCPAALLLQRVEPDVFKKEKEPWNGWSGEQRG